MKGQRRIVAGTKAARQGMARNQKLLVHHSGHLPHAGGDRALALEIDEHNRKIDAAKRAKETAKAAKRPQGITSPSTGRVSSALPPALQIREYTK